MSQASRFLQAAIVVAVFVAPGTSWADGRASAIYGIGVQMGMVELGAHEDVSPALLVRSLRHAKTSAVASGCIATDEIDDLIAAMSSTSSSNRLHGRITAYRQRLAREIGAQCDCAGAGAARGTRPPWLHGAWTYQTSSGFSDTHRLLADGRTRQGGTWTVRDSQLIIEWPNGWRNVYQLDGPARRLTGVSIGPDGQRVPSTLQRD